MQWILLVIAAALIYGVWKRTRPPTGITNFNGKVVLITGASSGIGKATAHKFAQMNARVVLVARRADILNEIQQSLCANGAEVVVVPADITHYPDLEQVINTVKTTYGHLDILVNNAGIVDTEPLENIDYSRIEQIIKSNLIAPINLTRLALPLLRKQQKAHIVNVSSTVGLTLVPRQSTYGASKAGLNGFTDAMRRELTGTGIGVSMVLPGLVNTPMLGDFKTRDDALKMLKDSGMGIPGVTLNEAGEVADKIIDAIRYNRREILLGGWMFALLSEMGRHTPLWLDGVYKQMFKTEKLQENVSGTI